MAPDFKIKIQNQMMMKVLTAMTLLTLAAVSLRSQTLINSPESIVQNETDQYSRIDLPENVSVRWRIANGVIVGDSTKPLVFFNVGESSPVILTAELSNGTTLRDTIPVYASGGGLISGTYPIAQGARQSAILQLLRGERFTLTTQLPSGQPKPFLRLLDFQGRFLAEGESIDFRAPVRGSYYLVIQSPTSEGALLVNGVRNVGSGSGESSDSTLIQPPAAIGRIDKEFYRASTHTGGESLIRVGELIVSASYDFQLRRTLIQAFRNDSLIWTFQTPENDYIRTLTAHSQFGIAGIGSCGGAGSDADSILMVLITPDGALKKRFSFGTSGYDYGYGVSFLNDGSIMATGFTTGALQGNSSGGLDAFAIRFSQTGGALQKLQYGTMTDDRVFASRTLPNGNVILFGDTGGLISNGGGLFGQGDIFLTEIDSLCNRIWTAQYGSSENDLAFDLVVEPQSSHVFLTGMTTGQLALGFGNPIKPQVFTMRVNTATRQTVWASQLGPNEGQSGESIALADSGVGVIFYTNGSFNGASNNSLGTQASDDMVVAFYDFNGGLKWLYQFDQTFERVFARGIAFQGNDVFVLRDHVYVVNAPFATSSLSRFARPTTSNVIASINPKSDYKLFQNYPNPFNPTTTISYELSTLSEVKLELFDVLGRKAATLVNTRQNSGRYSLSLNASRLNLSSGIYFYRFQACEFVDVKKMMLIK
jgi:hypothetical protein